MSEPLVFRFGCGCFFILLLSVLSSATVAQTQWNKLPGNPVLSPGPSGSWDETGAVVNTVRQYEGVYKMWYEGNKGFGLATSATVPCGRAIQASSRSRKACRDPGTITNWGRCA
jgi:hypothetical protein